MSRIRFRNNLDDPEDARLPDKFIDEFNTGSLLKKCDKFCFNSSESSIEYEDIDSFIKQFGDDMKELTIFETNIRNVLYALSQKDLINLIPSNLTKLEVVTERVKTQLIISMKRLKKIKTLRLGYCILKMIDGAVCAPVELRLKNIFFLRKRKDFQKCVKLNDWFDLSNLKVLHLDCSDTENIELDLSQGVLNLKTLVLDHVKVINWESSTWSVKKLTLCKKMKFATTTRMQFEELEYSGSILDVAVLPTTLKSLAMQRYKTKLLHIETGQNLVNLKYLVLHRKEFSLLTNFQSCANLTHLHLVPVEEDDGELAIVDVSLIPKTIKVFRLSHNGGELVGKIDFPLETVIIEHIPFGDAYYYVTENLKTKNVFLFCSDFDFDSDNGTEIEEVVGKLMFQSFIVGPFLQSKDDKFSFFYFNENPKAEYFIKTLKDGTVIKKEVAKMDIDRIKNLWWTNDEISF